jgi:hypothetical protein
MKRICSTFLDCAHAAGSWLSSLTPGFHSFFVIICVPCCLPIRSTFLLACCCCCWPLEQMAAAVWVACLQSIRRLISGCFYKYLNSRFVSCLLFGTGLSDLSTVSCPSPANSNWFLRKIFLLSPVARYQASDTPCLSGIC